MFEQFSLRYAFDGVSTVVGQCKPKSGPENQDGFIVANSGESASYNPTKQTWFEHQNGVWFGWEVKPLPSQLQRPVLLPSALVTLSDGNQWSIPIARQWVLRDGDIRYTESFARTLKFVDGDWVEGSVVREHELFESIGTIVFNAWSSAKDNRFVIPNANDLFVNTLSLNYRVSAFEVSAMGLLTNDMEYVWAALRQVIDVDGFNELQKKTQRGE